MGVPSWLPPKAVGFNTSLAGRKVNTKAPELRQYCVTLDLASPGKRVARDMDVHHICRQHAASHLKGAPTRAPFTPIVR